MLRHWKYKKNDLWHQLEFSLKTPQKTRPRNRIQEEQSEKQINAFKGLLDAKTQDNRLLTKMKKLSQ